MSAIIPITAYQKMKDAEMQFKNLRDKALNPNVVSAWRKNSIEFQSAPFTKKLSQRIWGLTADEEIRRFTAIEAILSNNPALGKTEAAQVWKEWIRGSSQERDDFDKNARRSSV